MSQTFGILVLGAPASPLTSRSSSAGWQLQLCQSARSSYSNKCVTKTPVTMFTSPSPLLLGNLTSLRLSIEPKIPSGKRLHNYGKSPCLMGKSTIAMAIFNGYASHYQRVTHELWHFSARFWSLPGGFNADGNHDPSHRRPEPLPPSRGVSPSSRCGGVSSGKNWWWHLLLASSNSWKVTFFYDFSI